MHENWEAVTGNRGFTFIKFYLQLIIFFSLILWLLDLLLLFLHHEDHVEDAAEYHTGSHGVESHVAVSLLDECAKWKSDDKPDGHEAVQEGESPGPVGGGRDVHHQGVGGEIEGRPAPCEVLETLQQQVLDFQFVEPDAVDEEDDV